MTEPVIRNWADKWSDLKYNPCPRIFPTNNLQHGITLRFDSRCNNTHCSSKSTIFHLHLKFAHFSKDLPFVEFIWSEQKSQRPPMVGGGTNLPQIIKNMEMLMFPGIFRCSFMYEIQGIYQFLLKVSFLPPYLGSENLENHDIRVKNQSCRK